MAIDFPSSPSVGQQYTINGLTYEYITQGVWKEVPAVTKIAIQTITATGAYTPTSGMKYAIFEMVAPGGGGGGINTSSTGTVLGGGGGGSGSYARSAISAATAALGITVTLGVVGSAGTAGGNGGTGGFSGVSGAAVTISIASPAVITQTNHGLRIGQAFGLQTSGTLPTGITALTRYFVIAAGFGANSFQFSATPGGTAVNTSGSQSGTHTIYYLTCNGGTGGTGTVGAATYPIGGGAGAAGIGDFIIAGTPGWFGFFTTSLGPAGPGGMGASSCFGGGGAQTMIGSAGGANGNTAIGFGAGGGGGLINNGTGSVLGGAGAAGVCVITEFL